MLKVSQTATLAVPAPVQTCSPEALLDCLVIQTTPEFLSRYPRMGDFFGFSLSTISAEDLRDFLNICLRQGGTETLWDFTCSHLINVMTEILTTLRDKGYYALTHESLINDFSFHRLYYFAQHVAVHLDLRQKLNGYLEGCCNPLPAMTIEQRHYFIQMPIVKFLQSIMDLNTDAIITMIKNDPPAFQQLQPLIRRLRCSNRIGAIELYRRLESPQLSDDVLIPCFDADDRATILRQAIVLV